MRHGTTNVALIGVATRIAVAHEFDRGRLVELRRPSRLRAPEGGGGSEGERGKQRAIEPVQSEQRDCASMAGILTMPSHNN